MYFWAHLVFSSRFGGRFGILRPIRWPFRNFGRFGGRFGILGPIRYSYAPLVWRLFENSDHSSGDYCARLFNLDYGSFFFFSSQSSYYLYKKILITEKFPPMTSCLFCDVIIRFDDDFQSNGNPAAILITPDYLLRLLKSFWGFAFATEPLSPLGEHLVFSLF